MYEDFPTVITIDDIDNLCKKFENGDFDIKSRTCWQCGKEFLSNYDDMKCDECFFAQFPKEDVKAFYKSFLGIDNA